MPDTNINLTGPGEGTLLDIKVALARIEERQVALQKADEYAQSAADHRHRNLLTVIEQFVPRREIEANNKAIHERIDAIDEKIKSSEKKLWGAIGFALTAFGGFLLEKLGISVGH